MKFLLLLLMVFLLPSCQDDRGCTYGSSKEECDEQLNPNLYIPTLPCDGFSKPDDSYCIDYSNTQQDIDNISGMSIIGGDLYILSTELSNLDFLSGMTEIQGTLLINRNKNLVTISSIASITSVGNLEITGNILLENLNGLDNINTIPGNFVIKNNYSLQEMGGVSTGPSSKRISIYNNPMLVDFQLSNLQTIGRLNIYYNINLISLGVESLIDVTEVFYFLNNGLCESDIMALRNRILTQTVETIILDNAIC